MRILVCGSRDWSEREPIRNYLASQDGNHTLIHGAARGADSIAGEVAAALGWEVLPFPAEWERYGRAAGPRRNRAMLAARPDIVVAFHDSLDASRGTKDMLRQARRSGVPCSVFSTLRGLHPFV